MSSTNRGKQRHRNDNYATPAWCVDRLLEAKPKFWTNAATVLEPCAGDGAIIRATQEFEVVPRGWVAIELRKAKAIWAALKKLQYTTPICGDLFKSFPHDEHYDLALTNPPFSLAWEMLHFLWKYTDHICFLLRLNFLGAEYRQAWLQQHMPDIYVLPNRPQFAKNKEGKWGTDSIEYAWMHWDTSKKQRKGKIQMLNTTLKSVRLEQRK